MNLLPLIARELAASHPLRDFSTIEPSDHLFDDLGLDSLDRETLAIGLEEALHIDLPSSVSGKWFTVGDVLASVARLVGAA